MKGLLLKDLYAIKSYLRAFLFLELIFILTACFTDGSSFLLFYPCILSGMIPMTLLAYEEKEHWNSYVLTLPYTRKQLVSAKYLLSLLLSAISALLILAAQVAKSTAGGSFASDEFLLLLTTLVPMSLLPAAFLLPFVFKLGAEKGRIYYYVMVGIFCACGTSLGSFTRVEGPEDAPVMLPVSPPVSLFVMLASVLLFFLSWRLSVSFYQKREL